MKLIRNFLRLYSGKSSDKLLHNSPPVAKSLEAHTRINQAPATRKLIQDSAPSIGNIDYAAPSRDAEIQYC